MIAQPAATKTSSNADSDEGLPAHGRPVAHPENLIPLEVPQKARVINMSERAITTMLARMARPAARPTSSGPPRTV